MGAICSSESGSNEQDTDLDRKRGNKDKDKDKDKDKPKMSKVDSEESKIDPNHDYSNDIGLKMNPKNEINGITYEIDKDLIKLKEFYGDSYKDLVKREENKTVFYDNFEEKDIELNGFTVMQFNILADALSRAYMPGGMEDHKAFVGVDKRCLEWRYRGIRLVEEILRMSPDIICLQECDRIEFFDKYFSKLGYKYEFQAKGESAAWNEVMPTINKARKQARASIHNSKKKLNLAESKEDNKESGDNNDDSLTEVKFQSDGCAIFYKSSKFGIINRDKTSIHKIEKTKNKQGVVGLAVPFTVLDNKGNPTKREFFAVTTHLKSTKNETGEKKRESQINLLLKDLISNNEKLPVLLCLDMNGNHKKEEYEPLCYNKLTKEFGYISLHKEAMTSKDELKNNINCGIRGKEPLFTTYKTRSTGTVKHTIDYIFESGENLWSVTKYWNIPDNTKMIPDWNYPSDHFSLCLHLTWNK